MKIQLPEKGLVLLMGVTGSGKSSFAARYFAPAEVVSSDRCRALVSDGENDRSADNETFEQLLAIVTLRLRQHRLTVVDAGNLRAKDRKALKLLAKQQNCLCSLIALDTPRDVCLERNRQRPDRNYPDQLIARHFGMFRQSLLDLEKERYHRVYRLSYPIPEGLEIERTPLCNDRKDLTGPFDIIGDLHGCATELLELLNRLGHNSEGHPEGRRLIFVGDITDRGPRNLDTYEIVSNLVERGQALCVAGNHDVKLLRYLRGKNVRPAHGLQLTVTELEQKDRAYRKKMADFIDSLVSHYVLDGGRLVVAHAGIKEAYQGRSGSRVRSFCLYGDTTGETDEHGLPVRLNWAAVYRGTAMVVYGHTPVSQPVWQNRTINIDTGCAFGGHLTALRYPELELVCVEARDVYCKSKRL